MDNISRKRISTLVDVYGRPIEYEVSIPRPARKPASGTFARVAPLPAPVPVVAPVRPSEAPRAPGLRVTRTAIVYVRGRRVAWSRTPDWSPLGAAYGKDYERARLDGLAGVQKSGVLEIVRDLLAEPGVDAVLVHSEDSNRQVHVSKPEDGGSIRAAWSESHVWSPFTDGRSSEARLARELGAAGVGVGLPGLRDALRGL